MNSRSSCCFLVSMVVLRLRGPASCTKPEHTVSVPDVFGKPPDETGDGDARSAACATGDEAVEPARRFGNALLWLGERDADVAGGGGAEGLARQYRHRFGFEQVPGKGFAAVGDIAHIDHDIHAAARTADGDGVLATQRFEKQGAAAAVAFGNLGHTVVVLDRGNGGAA